jgi:hypothetical protein
MTNVEPHSLRPWRFHRNYLKNEQGMTNVEPHSLRPWRFHRNYLKNEQGMMNHELHSLWAPGSPQAKGLKA